MPSQYEDEARMRAVVTAGEHRAAVGGLWDELGQLQFDFLVAEGLRPSHRFLDIGCGVMRAGVKLAPYLNPGHYYGIDLSPALLEAGARELASCGAEVPSDHLRATGSFDVSGWPRFDYAIAQSVFTHTPIAVLGDCLRAVNVASLYATFFIAPEGEPSWSHPDGIVTYAERDPFHTTVEAIARVAEDAGWQCRWIGEWNHPRGQQIAQFTPPPR